MSAAYLKVPAPNFEYKKDCTGKPAYTSLADAKRCRMVRHLNYEPYACEHCHHWHTRGPTPKWGRK